MIQSSVLLKEELISNIIAIFVAIYLNEYSNRRNLAVTITQKNNFYR